MENTIQNKDSLLSTISLRRATAKIELDNQINRLTEFRNTTDAIVEKMLVPHIEGIVKSLENIGLGINTLGYGKTGESGVWKEGDTLRVNITAVPTSDKFKFVKFDGYTSKGSGRNANKLNTKARKIEECIEKLGIRQVHVNDYSLEVKNDNETKRVLIDLYL